MAWYAYGLVWYETVVLWLVSCGFLAVEGAAAGRDSVGGIAAECRSLCGLDNFGLVL